MRDFAADRLRARGNAICLDEILQEECRYRFGAKFAKTLEACPQFRFPSVLAGEQATSDLFAREHARYVMPGAHVLDMTCGLGIDAMHLAMEGCRVTAIERDEEKARCAADNAEASGVDIQVVSGDSPEWLAAYTGPAFDVIFIDPARRTSSGRAFSFADCSPNAVELMPLMLSKASRVFVKASPMLDIDKARKDLGHNADIIIIGTPTECRELCAVVPGTGRLHAVTLMPERRVAVDLIDGQAAVAGINPEPGKYLCEPWPALMKAGRISRLAAMTHTVPIAQNTHLLIANLPPAEFPGNVYRIDAVWPSGKAAMRALKGINAQIAVRNYPMRADALERKLQARQSPDKRLYALTAPAGRMLVLTTPV